MSHGGDEFHPGTPAATRLETLMIRAIFAVALALVVAGGSILAAASPADAIGINYGKKKKKSGGGE